MRKALLVVLALAVALTFTGVASAAEQTGQPVHKEAKEAKAASPYKDLDLTREQKQQIKTIREQVKADVAKAGTPEEKMKIRKAGEEKIRSQVLTDKQREQLDRNQKVAKDAKEARHGAKTHKAASSQPMGTKRG